MKHRFKRSGFVQINARSSFAFLLKYDQDMILYRDNRLLINSLKFKVKNKKDGSVLLHPITFMLFMLVLTITQRPRVNEPGLQSSFKEKIQGKGG